MIGCRVRTAFGRPVSYPVVSSAVADTSSFIGPLQLKIDLIKTLDYLKE